MENQCIIKTDDTKCIHSTPIVNFDRDILTYMCGDFHRSIRLSRKLTNELTEIFGKHNATFRGEFFHKIWVLNFKGETFQLFSSNRGTTIEIAAEMGANKKKVIIDFLKEFGKLIVEYEKK